MQRTITLAFFATIASSAMAANLYSNQSSNVNQVALFASSTSLNGTAAPEGGFFTELQSDGVALPNTIVNSVPGFAAYSGAGATAFRLADDFVVGAGGWAIDGIKVYAYAPTAITGGNMKIRSGRPGDPGSTVIWDSGALAGAAIGQNTSITTNAGTGNLFRIFNSSPGTISPNTSRQITEFTFSVPNLNLAAGTYWIDYNLDRGVDQVLTPSTTHQGVRGVAGANARQFINILNVWTPNLNDTGLVPVPGGTAVATNVAQELPFIVTGQPVPEPATMTILGIAALVALRRRKK